MTAQTEKERERESEEGRARERERGWRPRSQETSVWDCFSHTKKLPTDLNVCLLVRWHLPEAERRDVAPHAKGLGDASARVAGINQVGGEGEQPARERRGEEGSDSK